MDTNGLWFSTFHPRPDMVFQEVIAILMPEYLHQLCSNPDIILAKLSGEIDGLKVEKVDMDDGNPQYHIRGSVEHILLFKIKIEKMMMDKQFKTAQIVAATTTTIQKPNTDSVNQLQNKQKPAVVEENGIQPIRIKQEPIDTIEENGTEAEPTETMTRRKRKVLKPRKVSYDVYKTENQAAENENRCEEQECSERMETSTNLPLNVIRAAIV